MAVAIANCLALLAD